MKDGRDSFKEREERIAKLMAHLGEIRADVDGLIKDRRDGLGQVEGILSSLQNEFHEWDDELARAHEQLLAETSKRWKAKHALKSALEALRAIDSQTEEYLALASHDLRTPLAIIVGQADLLAESVEIAGLGGYERRSVETIVTAAQQMNSMIQDLVDSIRLEAGHMKMNLLPIDLGLFICDSAERLASITRTTRICESTQDDLPMVLADTDKLDRILTNLLTNALKYSPPERQVMVEAKLAHEEVVVTVTDLGIGIGTEHLPHIFDRFYRATGVRKADGLGLGLYLTKLLVEAHGGRVWVESEPGKGSSFFFTLRKA